jgi:hypothetical protein
MSCPISDHATALALVAQLQERAAQSGLALSPPPPDPVGCCGRGCQGCVWEGYFQAVAYWRDEALLQLEP